MNVNSSAEIQANAMEDHEQTEAVLKARNLTEILSL